MSTTSLLHQLSQLRRLTQQKPDDLNSFLEMAWCLYQLRKYEQGLEAARKALGLSPLNTDGHYISARCRMALGDRELARTDLARAITTNEQHLPSWAALAELESLRGQDTEALTCWEKVIALQPAHTQAWQCIASLRLGLGDIAGALKAYQQALSVEANNPAALEGLGMAFMRQGHFQEALKAYQEAQAINPHNPGLWNNLGNCHLKLQQIEAAEEAYKKALRLAPEKGDYWYNLGELLFLYASPHAALEALSHACKLNPNDLEALYYLAQAQEEKQPQAAIQSYEKLLQAGKSTPEVIPALARLYRRTNQAAKEKTTRASLAKANPYDLENNQALLQLTLKEGKRDEALSLLEDLPLQGKAAADLWFQLSVGFKLENNLEKELDCLEETLKLDEGFNLAWLALARITLRQKLTKKAWLYFQRSQVRDIEFADQLLPALFPLQEWQAIFSLLELQRPFLLLSPRLWEKYLSLFRRYNQKDRLAAWSDRVFNRWGGLWSERRAWAAYWLRQGRLQLAQSFIDLLLQEGDDSALTKSLEFRSNMQRLKPEQLEQWIKKQLEANLKQAVHQQIAGEWHALNQREEEAKKAWATWTELQPACPDPDLALAELAVKQTNWPQAEAHLSRAEAKGAQNHRFFNLKAKLLLEQGEATQALDCLFRSTTQRTKSAEEFGTLARCYFAMENFSKGRCYAVKAQAKERKNPLWKALRAKIERAMQTPSKNQSNPQ